MRGDVCRQEKQASHEGSVRVEFSFWVLRGFEAKLLCA